MLRKMNLNKREIAGDDGTASMPFAERTRLLELNVLQYRTDHVTCDGILMKQPTILSTARWSTWPRRPC